ncbi:TIGR02680 family protein [Streptomyces monashensis]|uniref:TIGR02680 family protein n=1 Tax=Streptomyces monashensis TaxID=1678012 RepID=A0A1S2PU56_9ACTN|nr:TIGR02680 family protein [Streptomyces monashensis]OIJ97357.1 TIGR02680 family protein [Streptomyces monashensis]
MNRPLPAPARDRWQPLRIGLVDLFYYDEEEFHFRDGRLLLRGNNGTGKSKVLALTLPFLLDGDLSARRVEPDGDPKKRMEWNLLLGGEHPHPERLGYTWIEFGRLDEAGRAHFRTLLCGLKAVSGRGIARHWFAVTDQRIGEDLRLLDATGSALGRDRLVEAIGGRGMLYDQARAYRRAVDEALFGLGEQRYAALVDLLVQLRQPQLSKRPNEAALSRALTEALPPMDQAVIADVAEAFRSLDEEKDELRTSTEAERAASAFLEHYRRYARVASRRRARLPRAEHSRYEHLHRDLSRAQEERDAAAGERAEAEERIAALEETATRLSAQDAALRAGPEMRSARELERAAQEAARTASALTQASADRDQAARTHTRALERVGAAQNRAEAAAQQVDQVLAQARERAGAAALDGEPAVEGAAVSELRRTAEEALARRRRTVEHVERLVHAAEHADGERRAAQRRLDEAAAELDQCRARQGEAEAAATEAGRALVLRVGEHLDFCVELRAADPVGLLDRLQDWVVHLDGVDPVRQEMAAAHREAGRQLADAEAALRRRQEEAEARVDAARAELARLEEGGQQPPAVPATRTPGVRDGRPGAPLWRLVDFREAVSVDQRAGLEAALEASGLLDAWVCPDGTLFDQGGGHDVLIAPGPAVSGPHLGLLLRPAIDHGDPLAQAVGEAAVERLLAAIGLGAGGDTWVGDDGRFKVGALSGSWAKGGAEFVGEGAREEARRTRIALLADELAELQGELEGISGERETIAGRRRVLDAELAALPDDAPLRQAHAGVAAAGEATRRAQERHEERAADLTASAEHAAQAHATLADTAADLSLPAERDALAAVGQALTEYALALAALWPALRERAEAETAVADERAEAAAAGERTAELALRADACAAEAAAADEHHTTLRSTVGAAVAELERRLADTARALADAEASLKAATEQRAAADRRASRAEGRIEQLEQDVTQATAARAEAIGALQRFATTGLLTLALPEVPVPDPAAEPWAATPAIALARAVEAELARTDDSDAAWERVQSQLNTELKKLQDSLSRGGHSASARMVEDGMIVDVVYQGRERGIAELADALAIEVGELQRILSAHEREILETHLLTEVAGTLQELIGAAERQVRAMNTELEERPTSTGMRLRLTWRPARGAPAGLGQARERLRQSADAWSREDRTAVGEFLQEQIARYQSDDVSGSWLEHLTQALDYRTWHEFGIERRQHGKWVPATGPASGGERVLAVCVPLFAAASSHYASATSPHAPRLVTLDEAFAGVDDDSRAKCLGLLHAFDLDVVMTSEREWACYPQVPGIAIAQLSRVDEVAAVLVTRWEWDGTTRARGVDPHQPGEPGEDAATPEAALW